MTHLMLILDTPVCGRPEYGWTLLTGALADCGE